MYMIYIIAFNYVTDNYCFYLYKDFNYFTPENIKICYVVHVLSIQLYFCAPK